MMWTNRLCSHIAAVLTVLPAMLATSVATGGETAFSPVKYRATGETSFEVEVWGRTYRYENSVFPVSVKTVGREVFAAPMSLHAKFGDVEGEFRDWQHTTIVASNLSKTRRTAVLSVPFGVNVLIDLTTGERFMVSDGKATFPAEPFTLRIFAAD